MSLPAELIRYLSGLTMSGGDRDGAGWFCMDAQGLQDWSDMVGGPDGGTERGWFVGDQGVVRARACWRRGNVRIRIFKIQGLSGLEAFVDGGLAILPDHEARCILVLTICSSGCGWARPCRHRSSEPRLLESHP